MLFTGTVVSLETVIADYGDFLMTVSSTADRDAFTAALARSSFHEARQIGQRIVAAARIPGAVPSAELALVSSVLSSGLLDRGSASGARDQARSLAEQIIIARSADDKPAAERAAPQLTAVLAAHGLVLDEDMALRVIKALKDLRVFAEMARLADRLTALGARDPQIRKIAAQGLIETGHHSAALGTLDQMFAKTPVDHPEHVDGQGVAGRAFKQVYMDASKSGTRAADNPALRDALVQSAARYEKGYAAAIGRPKQNRDEFTYLGINLLAVLSRAQRDGVRLQTQTDAAKLREQIETSFGDNGASAETPWDFATLGEAAVARGDWTAAEMWLGKYAAHGKVNAFQLAGTIRQLEEVWQLDTTQQAQSRIHYHLTSQLLAKEGGHVTLSSEERTRMLQTSVAASGQRFEAIIEGREPKTIGWLQNGLRRADSVALIRHMSSGRGFGTGSLVRGGDFIASLGDQPVLLTNSHVVSEIASEQNGPQPRSIPIKKAKVEFMMARGKGSAEVYKMREVLWCSPRTEMDATLIMLDREVKGIEPLVVSTKKPAGGKSRVIVIGHPNGADEVKISLFESPVLQIGGKAEAGKGIEFLHYTNPTVGGNSGSPVFEDDDWEVVGLHHSGPNFESNTLPKLNGEQGEHTANEGIYIQSICAASLRESVGRRAVPVAAKSGRAFESVGDGAGPMPSVAAPAPMARARIGGLQSAGPATMAMPGKLAVKCNSQMTVGVAEVVTVNLTRLESEKLINAARENGNISLHDVMTYAAMTLRLTAPGGGFRIDPANEPTQFLDRDESPDDLTEWRWTVTPERTGDHELLLTAQGQEQRNGVSAALAAQQQRIAIKVRVNQGARAKSFSRWAAAAVVGGVLSWIGQVAMRGFWN